MALFFMCVPLVDISGQISYLPFEIISLLYIKDFIADKNYKDDFIIWYSLVFVCGIVVTILSVNPHRSYLSLRYWFIPFLVYVTLSKINIRKVFSFYIWIPTILFLLENIILFIYWSKFSYLFNEYPILNSIMVSFGDWPAKIYTSTVVLCMIIGIYFLMAKSKNRSALLLVNFISAFLSYDRAFWFSLLLIILFYLMLEKLKLSFSNVIKFICVLIISMVVLSLIMHLIGMDLHYKERFATYEYWLSIVRVSPIYGIGVGRDILYYYVDNYPIPNNILETNPFTKYTSHNFFLDLLVTQGFIGLIIFIIALCKINLSAIRNCVNVKYKYVSVYMTIAVFSKFLVDNQFDNRRLAVFWFFIIMGYLCSRRKFIDSSF